jgi:hypothetical protein
MSDAFLNSDSVKNALSAADVSHLSDFKQYRRNGEKKLLKTLSVGVLTPADCQRGIPLGKNSKFEPF